MGTKLSVHNQKYPEAVLTEIYIKEGKRRTRMRASITHLEQSNVSLVVVYEPQHPELSGFQHRSTSNKSEELNMLIKIAQRAVHGVNW